MNWIKIYSIIVISAALSFQASAQKLKWAQKRSVKRMTAHVSYLADDELEGRSTGSDGEKLSAEYIAGQFEKVGLEPKGTDGYFQKFEITTLRIADGASMLRSKDSIFALFKDFVPLSYSSNLATAKADIVDCGFGIEEKKHNDYTNVQVNGKIALIHVGSPDGVHPHSAYVAWHGIQRRVDLAVSKGAIGVVFYKSEEKTPSPDSKLSMRIKPSDVPVVFVTKPVDKEKLIGSGVLRVKILTDSDSGHNVVGFKDNGAEYTVVIGAHHDHLGRGEHGGSLADDPREIHNGADDNASGVAGLIELAKCLKRSKKWNKNNNYLFIAFSGEEMGLVGSKYFVNNPTINLSKVNYMLNMDMIGMLKTENPTLVINGVGTSPNFTKVINQLDVDDLLGLDKIKTTESGIGSSDHTSFYLKGIPSIHFFTGQHQYYHKPTDDIENLNYPGHFFVINYMMKMISELNEVGKLEYKETKKSDQTSRRRFKVTLGIVPDYVFDGEGMRMDAVRDGKPGQKAGMQNGDVLIALAGKKIANMSDYMEVLSELEPGTKTTAKVKRGEEIMDLTVQF
jgi:aminopeptidase YwaD